MTFYSLNTPYTWHSVWNTDRECYKGQKTFELWRFELWEITYETLLRNFHRARNIVRRCSIEWVQNTNKTTRVTSKDICQVPLFLFLNKFSWVFISWMFIFLSFDTYFQLGQCKGSQKCTKIVRKIVVHIIRNIFFITKILEN